MKRQTKFYFDHPEVWESMNQARFDREPPFLLEVFRRHATREVRDVLDVGCGTGGHLERLAEAGISGTGVDLNANMIEFARGRRPSHRFEVLDMRTLHFDEEFDAVFCLCTTFCYNTTNDDVAAALRGFRAALRPGGLAVIDVYNPIAFIQGRSFLDRLESDHAEAGIRQVVVHRVDHARQLIVETRSIYRSDGTLERSDDGEVRMFFPQELVYFVTVAGFEVAGLYGGFDTSSTALDTSRLIVVARRPADDGAAP